MANYSGTSGDVTIGAAAGKVTTWTATLNRAKIDVTKKTDGGFQTLLVDGKKDCAVSFEAVWDSSGVYTGSSAVPAIWADSILSLTLDFPDGSTSISGTFVVDNVEYSNPDGTAAVTTKITASSSGQFYAPGEPTS